MTEENDGWRSLAKDPPGSQHVSFFVGHSEGGRMDWVFQWPGPNGKIAFWAHGEHGNYIIDDYGPDVWHPGPPPIPNSDVGGMQVSRDISAAVALLKKHGWVMYQKKKAKNEIE